MISPFYMYFNSMFYIKGGEFPGRKYGIVFCYSWREVTIGYRAISSFSGIKKILFMPWDIIILISSDYTMHAEKAHNCQSINKVK